MVVSISISVVGVTLMDLLRVTVRENPEGVVTFDSATTGTANPQRGSAARCCSVTVPSRLVLVSVVPDSSTLEIADVLLRSGAIDLVVIDSVAALVPRAEIEGEMGDSHVGLQARLMSQALRKLTGTVSKSGATVIFINQIRMKIGVMFGSPETTSGGNALKFYASVRIDVRRIAALKEGETVVGNRTRVKVVKNKVAPPFRQAEFDIIYNEGISREGDLLDLAAENGIVEKSGSWYSYGGERIGQGRENARRFLKENPEVRQRLTEEVYAAHALKLPVLTRSAEGAGAELDE